MDSICLVCREPLKAHIPTSRDAYHYDCEVCGEYFLTRTAREDYWENGRDRHLSSVQRAALSYSLRSGLNLPRADRIPMITSAVLESLLKRDIRLPSPSEQARNLIRWIGDYQSEHGVPVPRTPKGLYAQVGAPNNQAVVGLLEELKNQGFIRRLVTAIDGSAAQIELSLSGWSEWETIIHGRAQAAHGFIAMAFGEPDLDAFVNDVLKPGVRSTLGLEVRRLDDDPKSGVIDNVMREAIQNAGFVLVDLTHGNRGAYWEAGYAEGLGKPVIYLCEESAFNDVERRPHFDVNHCTTVMWSADQPDDFIRRLCATISNSFRRS